MLVLRGGGFARLWVGQFLSLISLAWGGALADLLGVRQVIGTGAAFVALCGVLNFRMVRQTPAPRSASAGAADLPVAAPATAVA